MIDETQHAIPACSRCGRPLLGDPEDDPFGAADGGPICGECSRERNFEAEYAYLDQRDGSLDGTIEW
jgi:hypothetical protein